MSTQPNHTDRPHAEFGPSSLKHVHNCPGWESRGGTNEAAEMGTRIHEAVEVRSPDTLHNEKEVEIYEQLIRDMDAAVANIKELSGVEPTVHQEIRLEIKLNGCETFGTADIVAVAGPYACLHDHKTGIGSVDSPPKNWQSTAYAVGVFQKFPEVQTIFASFSIPQRGELLIGEYSRHRLDEDIERLSQTILRAQKVRPMWRGGAPGWEELEINNSCQYCKHQSVCPALGHTAVEIARRYQSDLLPADGLIASSDIDDPEVLARLYTVATIVEKWADGIRHKTLSLAKEGVDIPGYRLKSMGAKKNVVDKASFLQYIESLGINQLELLQNVEIPVTKIRDLYAGKAPKGKKTAWARQFEDGLEQERITEKGTERFTLTRD
jgi:hypothetical protein